MTAQEHDVEGRPSLDSRIVGRGRLFERGLVLVAGLLILLAGVSALVAGAGWLGDFRAERPVLDPLVEAWILAHPQVVIPTAVTLGLALFLLGLTWMGRALRAEPRPDIRLEGEPAGALTISSTALAQAMQSDAESITGVTRARARMAGSEQRPHLRLTLSLHEGTNVRDVWAELDHKVLSRAREALEIETVPAVIRLELDRAPRQRVR